MSTNGSPDYSRAALFDPIARSYGRIAPLAWPTIFRTMTTDVRSAQQRARTLLDAGTGSGYWIDLLAHDHPRDRCVGLDLSTEFLDLARSKIRDPNVELVHGSITSIPFPDNTFDGIVCAAVLDTLPDVDRALAEFARVLASDGMLSLVLRGPDRRLSRLVEYISRIHVRLEMALHSKAAIDGNTAERMVDRHWSRHPILPRISELASDAGLEVLKITSGPFLAHVLMRHAASTTHR